MGVVGRSFCLFYPSFLVFFLGFCSNLRHKLLNLNPWKEKSQSFSRDFFLLISGIFGDFLHRRFRNFLTVLFFYVPVLFERVPTFFSGRLFTSVAVTVCCCTKQTALRVIMTTITMMITVIIMYTALLFLLQLCGFSANFSLL